jgi:hypothetical protein
MKRLAIALLFTLATIGTFGGFGAAWAGPDTTVHTEVEAP